MKQVIKNVVLVHGAFADGSGWEAVFNILKKKIHGGGRATSRDLARRGREVHEGRDRPAVRAGGSGRPQLQRGRHH